jgi:thioredoxin 1
MKIRTFVAVAALAVSAVVQSAPLAYDETADAKAQVQQALAAGKSAKLPVLVIFGANWCEDCRALDSSLKTPQNAALVAKEFVVVKVDVGRFDKNRELSAVYGDPIKKGIPAAVIVSPDNQVLYSTKAGELSTARRMSDTGVYEFFHKAAATAKGKS